MPDTPPTSPTSPGSPIASGPTRPGGQSPAGQAGTGAGGAGRAAGTGGGIAARGAGEAKIRLRGLVKSFGAKTVLDGVSLDVANGESMVIIGASGTGKSVTLKHIIGLLK